MAIGKGAIDRKALERLGRKFGKMPGDVRMAARKAIKEGGEDIVALQTRLAPQGETGNLKAGGKVVLAPGDLPAADIVNKSRIAHLVEFGTPPHKIRARRKKVMATQGSAGEPPALLGKEVDHPGAKPQPFFFPAYRAKKTGAKARVSRAITKAVKDRAKRG